MDGKADVPGPRRAPKDQPARQYNAPPGFKLFDIPGLLLVLGIVLAGVLLAVLFIRAGLGA
ncbi:MAG: hypothetical protein ACXV3S_11020 [Kineosporiaceae bacterium]